MVNDTVCDARLKFYFNKFSFVHHSSIEAVRPKPRQNVHIFFQIGINPGLMAAYKGHHYPGPGNHFCKWSLFYYYFTFKLDIFVNSLVFKKQIVFLIKDIVYICKYTYTFSLCVCRTTPPWLPFWFMRVEGQEKEYFLLVLVLFLKISF